MCVIKYKKKSENVIIFSLSLSLSNSLSLTYSDRSSPNLPMTFEDFQKMERFFKKDTTERNLEKKPFDTGSIPYICERLLVVLFVFFIAHHVFFLVERSREVYLKSLSEPLEGGGTGDGASGMLFFHTADWKYVVKQVKKAERDVRWYHFTFFSFFNYVILKGQEYVYE